MSAADLFAICQGMQNSGPTECYYCASAAERIHAHAEPPRLIGQKITIPSKRPGNSYMCAGCNRYRYPFVTVNWLEGGLKDRQSYPKHSWWMTEEGIWAIRRESHQRLYDLLLKPPRCCCLSLLRKPGVINYLQMAICNDMVEVRGSTVLSFTIDNIPYTYSPYELDQALRHGVEGKEPGVRALVEYLGECTKVRPEIPFEEQTRGRGRPPKSEQASNPKKVLAQSGNTVG